MGSATKKGRRAPATVAHDWVAIRSDYVSSRDSIEAVAERHGVSRAALGRHCRAEDWVLERERWQTRVNEERLKVLRRLEARREVEIDRVVHHGLWAVYGALMELLAAAKSFEEIRAALDCLTRVRPMLRVTSGLTAEREEAAPAGPPLVLGVDAAGHQYLELGGGQRVLLGPAALAEATREEAPAPVADGGAS